MIVENRTLNKEHILFCPFSYSCILPQTVSICKFPNYKICPEFQDKEKKIKLKFRLLY
ncbi:MAG: hypothetical protein KGD63_05705 [Candidatus Lokiarchaeota archaeon]|nr:hypothetical protein [Candidatus Lokiarchaeota archaeon]